MSSRMGAGLAVESPAVPSVVPSRPPEAAADGASAWWSPVRRLLDALLLSVPGIVALVLGLPGVAGPSLWRDEAVTAGAAVRSVPEIFRLLGHIDAVHGLYYLLMHEVVRWPGATETALRMPSVVAAAVAAVATAALGRRLASTRVGVTAGLLVAAWPIVVRYEHEARSYALCMAGAAVVSWLFAAALDRGDRRSFAVYGLALTALGALHIFTLLLVPAHAVTLLAVGRDRMRLLRWWVTVAAAGLVLTPLVVFSQTQQLQVAWLKAPTGDDVWFLVSLGGSMSALISVLALAPWGAATDRAVRWMALPWMLIPPAVLLAVSLNQPIYLFRYVLFCVPAAALLVAAGLWRLPWPAGVLTAALLAGLLPADHQEARLSEDRQENLRALAQALEGLRLPDDAVVFPDEGYRRVVAAYPAAFAGVRDVYLAGSPSATGTIDGVEVRPEERAARLTGVTRIWIVLKGRGGSVYGVPARRDKFEELKKPYGRTGEWHFPGCVLYLYELRRSKYHPAGPVVRLGPRP